MQLIAFSWYIWEYFSSTCRIICMARIKFVVVGCRLELFFLFQLPNCNISCVIITSIYDEESLCRSAWKTLCLSDKRYIFLNQNESDERTTVLYTYFFKHANELVIQHFSPYAANSSAGYLNVDSSFLLQGPFVRYNYIMRIKIIHIP